MVLSEMELRCDGAKGLSEVRVRSVNREGYVVGEDDEEKGPRC